MSADRFKWLEFGDDDGGRPPIDTRGPLPGRDVDRGKDENWHLAEADREYTEGNFEPALRNYSAALKYKLDLEAAWVGQARSMVALGQIEQAVTWGRKGMEKLPTSALMASTLGYVYARAGSPQEGMQMSDQILAASAEGVEQAPWFWVDRGVCLLELGQLATASTCMKKAAEITSGDPDWLQRIGFEYLLSNDPTRAMTALNKALEKRSDRAFLWLLTARTALKMNLNARAVEALDQVLSLDPANREAAVERGKMLSTTRNSRPCWIASLVFQDEAHPVVDALRRWRDDRWLITPWGRLAAGFYDLTAPLLCVLLVHLVWLHAPLRRGLQGLACRLALFAPPSTRVARHVEQGEVAASGLRRETREGGLSTVDCRLWRR